MSKAIIELYELIRGRPSNVVIYVACLLDHFVIDKYIYERYFTNLCCNCVQFSLSGPVPGCKYKIQTWDFHFYRILGFSFLPNRSGNVSLLGLLQGKK